MLFTKCVRIEFGDFVSEAGLLQKGFREVEELVTYVRSPAPCSYSGVKEATLWDCWKCMLIARNSFSFDRRHADDRYGNGLADLAKIWAVARGFCQPSSTVFVAERNRGVAGFLIGRRQLFGARIDLVGVGETERRKGIGKALIFKAMDYYASDGCSYILAGTQAHNTASCKFYESLGFVIGRRQRTFHR